MKREIWLSDETWAELQDATEACSNCRSVTDHTQRLLEMAIYLTSVTSEVELRKRWLEV